MASTQDVSGPAPSVPSGASRGASSRRRRPARRNNDDANPDQPSDEGIARTNARGRGHGHTNTRPKNRPPAVGSLPAPAADEGNGQSENQNTQRTRGSQPTRRSRGGRLVTSGIPRNQHINNTRTVQGRQFGGQLTQRDSQLHSGSSTPNSAQLNVDAPAFTPGLATSSSSGPRRGPAIQAPKRRASKSSAPDISTRIHEDVDNKQYECAVCTNEILRNSKIWSCRTCWSVFHISCAKKWATSAGSAVTQSNAQNGEIPPPRQWRCPGCNLPKDEMPAEFTCWCEKEVDPRPIPGLPPFTCGQTCSRPHVLPRSCPHPCSTMCHAGPCAPCPLMGPSLSCFCGRESRSKRCVDTDYDNGWSCEQVCNEIMPCGEHYCGRPCHEGLCGACEVPIDARCYCGQVEREIPCCDRQDEKTSLKAQDQSDGKSRIENWVGLFQCENKCERPLDCGKHSCLKPCHTQDEAIAHCPRSPDVVTHCPCGKTPLADISSTPRTSCEDPISACSQPCLKPLICGHACQRICHTGDCMPCFQTIDIDCRCGRSSHKSMCHQGNLEHPQCMRVCRVTLNCGRHECGEYCCTGERLAAERTANKKKQRSLHSALQRAHEGEFEAEHICTRVCGRPLKCGTHTCQELCHRGACGTCREAIFDEISCHCGRTVLQPPLPCGTQPPPCRFECERARACGHPHVSHNCHSNEEACPKCPFLTTKPCLCAKNQLKNQPCWLTEVRCGEVCRKKLRCGFHRCRKPCHRPGDCEDAGKSCLQACGKEKSCEHPCSEACHSPFPCKEDKQCQHKIFITCTCQRIKQETRCNASKSSDGNTTKSLACDDECLRLERNRNLQLAFNIDPKTHTDDHVPYAADTINMYLANPTWALAQEKLLRAFAANPDEKRLRFKPMKANQRAYIHAISQDFGFDSESMDPEPHRHVALFKTPRFVMAPMKTIADCVRIKQMQQLIANPTAPTTAAMEFTKKPKANNLVGDPFNAYLVTRVQFGLTIEDIRKAISSVSSSMHFAIDFLLSEEILLRPTATALADRTLELELAALKPAMAKALSADGFGSVQLCRVDDSLNIERRESDSAASGWSQVAAKAAVPRRAPVREPFGVKSSFVVLGRLTSGKEKKKANETNVVEDWEEAEAKEEEKEKERAGGSVASSEGETDTVKKDGHLTT